MIISSLCEFYNKVLVHTEEALLPEGYAEKKMHYQICLTPEGDIERIVSLAFESTDCLDGVKSKSKRMEFPDRVLPYYTHRWTSDVNFPEYRSRFLFGLEYTGNGLEATGKAQKSFDEFRAQTLEFFDGVDDPLISAYCNFARKWNPSAQTENEFLIKIGNKLKLSNFEFVLSGAPENRLQENPVLKRLWDEDYRRREAEKIEECEVGQCSVYGVEAPIARVHDKIELFGEQGSGCTLSCVNNDSEESYGRKQGANCMISYRAMKEYTAALNYLLKTDGYHTAIGDMTFVYFALADVGEEKSCQDLFNLFFSGDLEAFAKQSAGNRELVNEANRNLSAVFLKIKDGRYTGFDVSNLNRVEYCVFGLVPNDARISVRFACRNTFGVILKNVARYHEDFGEDGAPTFRQIAYELDKPDALKKRGSYFEHDIAKSLLETMIQGSRFSQKIFYDVVTRIKVDQNPKKDDVNKKKRADKNVKFNDVRDGIVRACLNRNSNKYREEKIGMALNTENKSIAYLCGRLLAVLEKIQRDSADGELDRTIVDSYFSSAATRPATVFPSLLMRSQYHLSKLREGLRIHYERLLDDIFDNIEIFPKTLTLEQQGEFTIGYRHQNKELYKSNEKKGDVQ